MPNQPRAHHKLRPIVPTVTPYCTSFQQVHAQLQPFSRTAVRILHTHTHTCSARLSAITLITRPAASSASEAAPAPLPSAARRPLAGVLLNMLRRANSNSAEQRKNRWMGRQAGRAEVGRWTRVGMWTRQQVSTCAGRHSNTRQASKTGCVQGAVCPLSNPESACNTVLLPRMHPSKQYHFGPYRIQSGAAQLGPCCSPWKGRTTSSVCLQKEPSVMRCLGTGSTCSRFSLPQLLPPAAAAAPPSALRGDTILLCRGDSRAPLLGVLGSVSAEPCSALRAPAAAAAAARALRPR